MPTYHLNQSDLVSLFNTRALIAADNARLADTQQERVCLAYEAQTWSAAAQILAATEFPDSAALGARECTRRADALLSILSHAQDPEQRARWYGEITAYRAAAEIFKIDAIAALKGV